ncbi:uncharacterized protein LOC143295106 [Babylonia areolata]|uniref:uncharacterized protein LOC143295106 n=1 Tax=Babylonia areolata TaxID=304850 RepID=UPI003FD58CB9
MSFNINANLIRAIQNLYENASSAVYLNGDIGDWLRTTVGISTESKLNPAKWNQDWCPLQVCMRHQTMADVINEFGSTEQHNVTDLIFNNTQTSETSKCVVLRFEGFTPWDNPDSLVSPYSEDLVRRIRNTVILPLFLIGGPANVINMAVFYRQGLKERINVCLFSLSLCDFLYLLCNVIVHGEQIHLQFTTKERYGPVIRVLADHNLLGFYGFTWVSEFISAMIASERCFCILQPLRSQTVLSTSTTTVIITTTGVVILALYSIVVTRFRSICYHDPVSGNDLWTVIPSDFYFRYQQLVDALDGFVFGLGIPVVTMVVVMVTTVVTMVKLRQAAAWRSGTSSSGSVSAREVALTVMLVYNSIFFVICVFPVALFRVVWLFIPEMNAGRSQHNMFFTFLSSADIMSYINATFNIAVYYTMGSRYRQTFWQLLGRGNRSQTPASANNAKQT